MSPSVISKVKDVAWMVGVARRAGLIRRIPPGRLLRANAAARGWGRSMGGVVAANSVLFGDRVHVVDDLGELTFAEVHSRTNAMARGLTRAGVEPGATVAILCRNHRYFVD